jgi:AraC-like DNA-binding protein
MPPHAFQTQARIARAKTLLRQGRAISEVARLTGFADQSHLTRHFKRLVKLTPGEYQQKSKNVQDRGGGGVLSSVQEKTSNTSAVKAVGGESS